MERRSYLIGLLVVLATALLCRQSGVARVQRARPGTEFKKVASQALSAVARGDWTALRRCSGPRLVVAQYTRAYLGDLSDKQARTMFPLVLFNRDDVQGNAGLYHVIYRVLKSARKLSTDDARIFRGFCKIVKGSWTTERRQNVISESNPSYEVRELTGPAVSGTFCSNVDWRIELGRDTGHWRVTRLVLTTH